MSVWVFLLICLLVPQSALCEKLLSKESDGTNWDAFFGVDPGEFVSRESFLILGVSGMASVWTWEEFDERQHLTQKALEGSWIEPALDIGNVYGSGWLVGGGSLSLLASGHITGKPELREFGGDLLRSYLYTGGVVLAIKHSVKRTRPSGGELSFPSGHTATAFSTVPVVWHHFGWQAGVASSALSVCTGLARLENNLHYLSDVIIGATIGLVVGRAVVGNRKQNEWLEHVVVTGQGVSLVWSF